MKEDDEITYDQAAEFLDCSPRHLRRVLKRSGIEPIRKGHRTVRFKAGKIFRLKLKLAFKPEPKVILHHGRQYKLLPVLNGMRGKGKR